MSSVITGIEVTTVGAVMLMLALLGSRLFGKKGKTPTPRSAWVDYSSESKATAIVPVTPEPEAPAKTLPPPPPSKTSGLHFAPASMGAPASPGGRRYSGKYVRRAAPKRSTATSRKPEGSTN